ncbi:DNA polymerase kappa [Aphelenchoides fujianensis]|nr:DNA polymerase kappa [Aphelenchoides fujianensis]
MLGGRSLGRKCGMEGEYINQVIEAKSSANYKAFNEKKTLEMQAKLAEMKEQLEKASVGDRQKAAQYQNSLERYEAERDLSRVIVHLDMDAFFAAVEQRDDPSLRKIPFAVGSTSMISTSNYIARSRGVRSAMPGYIGRSLCPELKFVPVNMEKYRGQRLTRFEELFAEYDPTFHPGGLDEATLDFTEHLRTRQLAARGHRPSFRRRLRMPTAAVDRRRRPTVPRRRPSTSEWSAPAARRSESPIASSVTFGNTKGGCGQRTPLPSRTCDRVDVLCGNREQRTPGENLLRREEARTINSCSKRTASRSWTTCSLWTPDGSPVWGPVWTSSSKGLGINTCGDILERQADIALLFSDNQTHFLIRSALGIGRQYEESDENVGRQTISSERTFAETSNLEFLEGLLNDCVRNAFESMLEDGYTGSCRRSRKVAKTLMLEMVKGKRVRLIGVTLSNFVMARQKQKSIDGFIHDDDEVVFEKVVRKPKKPGRAAARPRQDQEDDREAESQAKPPCMFGQPLPQKVPTKQTKIDFPRVRSPPNREVAGRPNGNPGCRHHAGVNFPHYPILTARDLPQ